MADKKAFLSVKDLTVEYVTSEETVYAVNGVSFSLEKGKTLGLVGETGAGKTSIARAILRILPVPPAEVKGGVIELEGKDLMKLPEAEMCKIRGNAITMIFQDPMTALNPTMQVGRQIAEVIRLHNDCSAKEAEDRACEMLEIVGIPRERYTEYPHQFSGGMKQRVVIAIALACNPDLLLADEPTTALDVTIQAQVLNMMIKLKNQLGTSMLFVTHDLGIVAEICDEVAVMYAGRIIERGTLIDVFNHTKHPYTEGLFNSLPNIEDRKSELKPIPGLMPDPTCLPKGCAFAPRCPYAKPECIDTPQTERYFNETHSVMCSAYDDPAFHIEREEIEEDGKYDS